MKKVVVFICWCLFLSSYAHAQKRLNKRVLVIGVDGLNVYDLEKANTPNIDSLRKQGAWTYAAKTVMPSSSSPNWASMTMGAPPDLTTIHANGWDRQTYIDSPTCAGSPKFFPSIFSEMKRQRPKDKVDIVHQWWSMRALLQRKDFNRERATFLSPKRTMKVARRYFAIHKPALLFTHFDQCDHAGHEYGHGSPEYIAAVELMDKMVGKLVKKLKKKGLYENTYILLTSDHGGIDHGHGGDTPQERNIPWILTGPTVKKDYELKSAIVTYDTALTIAKILDLKPHACWTGKAVEEAFQ
ncbi:MAG: alkaline phosphatase [Chitinophagales bacterium]|nr:alkaline phosphatase [Chitinophagales bacterium]